MATRRASSPAFAVIDASVVVALCCREPGRYDVARKLLSRLATDGTEFYAPSVIVAEGLHTLCQKQNVGVLTPQEHVAAVQSLRTRMKSILPPPHGDVSLIERAERLREGFGCSRSSDALYIALAERMGQQGQTELITFDRELQRQVQRNAVAVNVCVL